MNAQSAERSILLLVAIIPAAMLVVGVPLGLWWLWEPAPLTLRYVSPYFVSEPVESREHAMRHAVHETRGGIDLFRYVEYCIERPFTGTVRRAWVNEALVWHAPDIATQMSQETGCHSLNVRVVAPTSSPTRVFDFVQTMEIQVNPLRTDTIQYEPIKLVILDGKK